MQWTFPPGCPESGGPRGLCREAGVAAPSREFFKESEDLLIALISGPLADDGVDAGVGSLGLVEGADVELSHEGAPDDLVGVGLLGQLWFLSGHDAPPLHMRIPEALPVSPSRVLRRAKP